LICHHPPRGGKEGRGEGGGGKRVCMSKGGGMSKGCKLQLGEGGGSGNVNSGTVSVDKQEG